MGFFGGLIGVIIALALFVRRRPGLTSMLGDEAVMMVPIGISLRAS